ncbi:hypothetical protein JKF63_01104 [Porcisia hertigi]|uniref:Transmembrane protein n=1 Tax=Porcisia hertigi TaxID=2761500 RepID=A0A836HFV9_9TRYP|nr:hypothetical protein JKF63_01104 [Porcisia hertigi]
MVLSSLAPFSRHRGTRYVRTVAVLLTSLVLAILLLGGQNNGGDHGNFMSMTGHRRWHGVPLAIVAIAKPSEEPNVDNHPVGDDDDTVEPVEFRAPDADESFLENEMFNFNDEAEAEKAAAAATAAGAFTKSPTAHLDVLSVEELKALLSEKKKGWVNLNAYKDREALIGAIYGMEQKEAAQRAFRAQVAAAAGWYAEKRAKQKVAYRGRRGGSVRQDGAEPAVTSDTDGDEPPHKLVVVYNEASGYKSKFEELRKELKESPAFSLPNFADFDMVGQAYSMSPGRVLISRVLQWAFFILVGFALLADQLHFIPVSVRTFLRSRRSLMTSAALLLNVLSSVALQNNAFEVFLDTELLYSSTDANGELPTAELLSSLLLERTLLKDYYAATKATKA